MFVNSDFTDLLKLFNDNRVKYLVIGGYAVIQYAEPRELCKSCPNLLEVLQMSTDPYQSSSYRITKAQWEILNKLFVTIEPPAQNELYASGDHYLLYLTLRKMGFKPPSDAIEIYRMVEKILAEGWDE